MWPDRFTFSALETHVLVHLKFVEVRSLFCRWEQEPAACKHVLHLPPNILCCESILIWMTLVTVSGTNLLLIVAIAAKPFHVSAIFLYQ